MKEKVIQINGGIINVDMNVKMSCVCERDYVWNHAACNCENGRCLVSLMDNHPAIICDKL